ncbi:hypothetical protein DSM112329_02866 [Paraconexibacter sp. AEG42_29]|uniref:Uncharacterized protein n=1 Tax=Paraconexibacter sp. AEG42_29 TaxID=2997339 RepID=A0AAU7AWD5_9ACTN
MAKTLRGSRALTFVRRVYTRYIRELVPGGKARYAIVAATGRAPSWTPPAACTAATGRELERLLGGQPATVAAAGREAYTTSRRETTARPQAEMVLFFTLRHGRISTGTSGDVASLQDRGIFVSAGGRRGAQLTGLIPDGVATVQFRFPRTVSLGKDLRPRDFGAAYTRTVHVRDNVVDLHVPRPAEFALSATAIWRAPNGVFVRTVKGR